MPILTASTQLSSTAEEEAYLHLQQALRRGRYKPGDRLIPEEIAAEIGMSRMPVREAFRRLAADGLVTLRPNRGCVVAGLTLDEIYETFEIRSVLEGLAVRLATARMNDETSEELDGCSTAWNAPDTRGVATGCCAIRNFMHLSTISAAVPS